MPDQKLSVSSAEEALMSPEVGSEVPGSCRLSIRRLVPAVLASLAVLVAMVALTVCAHRLVIRPRARGNDDLPLYVNLMVNTKAVPRCQTNMTQDSVLPCMKGLRLLTGGADTVNHADGQAAYPLGPMMCWDDAFTESGGLDNCRDSQFRLVDGNTGVVIPETGVYRVRSTVLFVDSVDYYVDAIIRVNAAGKQGHGWLSCFNHNRRRQGSNVGSQFSDCTIDGVRRFSRGDVVSLQTTQRYRSVNPFRKVTNLLVRKL